MKIKSVDFHDDLLKAQAEGNLVIFAGAGVSRGSPSNYPDFNGLVKKVAKWAREEWKEKKESPERYLGRLAHKGLNIHQQVAEILSSPESKYNTLHGSLLQLFRNREQVKIVTTNFDSHFDSAALKVFEGKLPEIFKAPVLPLGNDFSGIVYLHGSVAGDPKKLVLTDQDFGRAYLTEGWCTRFLLALFSRYTVLFIGYSHNDIVMHYLARGLPPSSIKPRFALIREDGNSNDWEYRGIRALQYPFKGSNDHTQLVIAISGWSEELKRGALEIERRVKDYVSSPPLSLNDAAKNYLKWAIKDTVTLRFFTRHAKNPEWLIWANENKILDPLFSHKDFSQIDKELSSWIVDNFVVEHADALFLILSEYENNLNPWFVYEITHHIARIETIPEKHVISKWVPILIQNTRYSKNYDWLDSYSWIEIIKRALRQDALGASMLLFKHITTPQLNIKKHIPWYKDELDKEPTVYSDLGYMVEYLTLKEVWETDIKPRLSELATQLWPITIQNLNYAYHLLKSWDKAKTTWDPISSSRAAIESHPQNNVREALDILIDSARDCLEWTLVKLPQVGQAWIESISPMEPLIFKRLAIHGVFFTSHLIANDKIKWVIDKDFLFVHGLKHEIFQLLKNAYPNADLKWRKILLDEALKKIENLSDHEGGEHKEYIKFNFLYWLSVSAPDCGEIATQLALVKRAHPDFEPRKYPDLDHYFYSGETGSGGSRSPVSVEELLKKRPSEWFEYFMTFKGDAFDGPDRDGLIYNISKAVYQDFEWGRELADLLIDKNKLDSDFLGAVIRGWYDLNLLAEQWEYILTILSSNDIIRNHFQYITNLLQYGVKKE
ncbi:MAG: SIR2 family protein, partial [Deltaproteobacteria bacterium]|nr:SIR2 family protein [Deltaproteobacteria bacterium]